MDKQTGCESHEYQEKLIHLVQFPLASRFLLVFVGLKRLAFLLNIIEEAHYCFIAS